MKPSFALSLSQDGIRLLHRGRGGWVSVGDVALDDPDITDRLAWLRKTAAGLAQGAVTTKLVIPNSEILYDRIELRAGSAEKREAQLRGALDGRTPYAVDQLAYDYVLSGDVAQVAVVARETLIEAEAFATEHRFNPICFVAIPPDGDEGVFDGEPMFGTTSIARNLLDASDPYERDDAPIRVMGSAKIPEAGAEAPVVDVADLADVADDLTEAADRADTHDAGPEPTQQDASELDAEAIAAALVMEQLPKKATPDTRTPPKPSANAAEAEANPTPDAETAKPVSVFASRRARDADPGDAPVEDDTPSLRGRRSRLGFGASAPNAAAKSDAGTGPDVAKQGTDTPAAPPPPDPRAAQIDRATDAPKRREPRFGMSKPAAASDDAPVDPRPSAAKSPDTGPQPPVTPLSATPPSRGEPSPAALARLAAIVPNRKVAPDSTAEPAPTAITDAPDPQALGIAPARRGENPAPLIKKPLPIGLILTGVLLAILLIGAVLLMLFVDEAEQQTLTPEDIRILRDLETAPLSTTAVVPTPRLSVPEPETQASLPDAASRLVDELDEAELADAEPTAPEQLAEPELPGIDADLETPLAPPRLTLIEAEALFAATGIWVRSPDALPQPEIVGLADLYLASLDPVVTALDAVALPGYAEGRDLRPITPRPAVGPDATFSLDENGLVTATPEGTLNPEGVRVRIPADDTARPLARPTSPDAVDPAQVALATARPRPRPDNAADLLERAALDGFTRAELAALRPRARPESEQAIASAAAIAAGASTAGVIADNEADGEPEITGSDLAVASSRSPNLRPSNIAQIVATARATTQPEPTRVAAVRAPSSAPQIPTRASVARQATIENAISLRQINLIGVYGSPADRRALVRLSNGRYVKVGVGDRVDGGQVAAIGESSLQYVKSGRNVTLSLPAEG